MVADLLFGNGTAAQAAGRTGDGGGFGLGIVLLVALLGVILWYVRHRGAS